MCDRFAEECMTGCCVVCGNLKKYHEPIKCFDEEELASPTTWYKWSEDGTGRTVKTMNEGTIQDLLDQLASLLTPFLDHEYVCQKQLKYFEDLCAAIQPGYAVLQVNFSENYSVEFQDEVQSAHWNKT